MIEKGFPTRAEWNAHIQTHPFVAHDIWPRIREYVPGYGYSRAEIDAMFEGYSGGGKAQVDFTNVVGMTPGAIPFGSATGAQTENTAILFLNETDQLFGFRETTPTALVHIHARAVDNVPCLNLEAGANGEIVTPDGQVLRIGHWNSGTVTFTERMKMDASGLIYISYLSTASVVFSGAGGELKQDNANFRWDNTLKRLGLGTVGQAGLHVALAGVSTGGGAATEVVGLFENATAPKHVAIAINAQAGRDAILYLSIADSSVWGIRNDASAPNQFQIRYQSGGANRTDFLIDTSGNIQIPTGYLGIMGQHELRFYEGANYVGFEAPALGGNQIWVLPNADGPANEALATDGAGNLIWRTHDELAGFEADEHVALPNTIANVLSDHNKAGHDALGLSHDSLVDVSIDDHHARDHQATHNNGGADALKLDDLAVPDDNVDLDFSTARHGLVPKGTDVGNFLKDDGTWAACAGGDNDKVGVDAGATPGYLGAGAGDGVLRVDAPLTYADGGDFVTLGIDVAYIDHGGLGGLEDDDHTQYILHSLADAVNDFLVASGANTYVKKTLAETGAILETDLDHGNIQGLDGDDHTQYLLANAIRALSANWDVGAFFIRATYFYSDIATGTAPLTVLSTTLVTNLNADRVDGEHANAIVTKARVDAVGPSHDSLVDVSIDDHHARDHAATHNNAGADELNHDNLAGFVAGEHLLVGAIDHDSLLNYVAGEHLLVGAIDHDSLLNFVADEHIAHALGRVKIRDARADGDVTPDNYPSGQASFVFTDDIVGSPNSWDSMIVMKGWSAGYAVWQLFSCSDNGPSSTDLLFRVGIDASWGSIRTIWDSGNDGPGSGLNADLWDGNQFASYLNQAVLTSSVVDFQGLDILRTAGSALTVSLTSTEDAHLIVEGDRDNDDEAMHAWASFLQDGGVRWLKVGVGEAANNNSGFLHGYEGIEFWIGSSFPGGSKIAEILSTGLGITGTLAVSGAIAANGGLTQDGFTILNGADTWLRTSGATGWYSATYSVGWYATEAGKVKPYNNAHIDMNNQPIEKCSALYFTATSYIAEEPAVDLLRFVNANGYAEFGRDHLNVCQINTDAASIVLGVQTACIKIGDSGLAVYLSGGKLEFNGGFFLSTAGLVANNKVLDSDKLDGYHASSVAGNNTIVLRTGSGYIYCNYLNTTSGETGSNPTHYFVETGNDSFLRQMTPANFISALASDGLMSKGGGAFTGLVTARDHGAAAVDEIVNVCYGTGSPPVANTTTIGTLWIKYTA